jgi:hypothetical protein
MAIRGSTNERSEFLMAPLPIVDTSSTSTAASIVPHVADGGGWITEVLLVNPSDDAVAGTIQFFSSGGQTLSVTIAGQTQTQFSYSLPPRSAQKFRTSGSGNTARTGSVRVLPSGANRTPDASAVLVAKSNGVTTTQMVVPGTAGAAALRVFAERSSSVQPGIAVANFGTGAATVNLELTSPDGTSTIWTGTLTIPAQAQTGLFLSEIAGGALPASFSGVLRLSATAGSKVSAVGFRLRLTERSTPDLIVSSVPVVDESLPASSAEVILPRWVDSGGYSTEIVLFNASVGTIRFFSAAGQPAALTFR